MALFKPRAPRVFGQATLLVAAQNGKCPLCRVGEPDKNGKMMIGTVEIAACERCKGLVLNGLSMAKGLGRLAGWLKASRDW